MRCRTLWAFSRFHLSFAIYASMHARSFEYDECVSSARMQHSLFWSSLIGQCCFCWPCTYGFTFVCDSYCFLVDSVSFCVRLQKKVFYLEQLAFVARACEMVSLSSNLSPTPSSLAARRRRWRSSFRILAVVYVAVAFDSSETSASYNIQKIKSTLIINNLYMHT